MGAWHPGIATATAAQATSVRHTTEANNTTIGPNEVVVQIHLVRLGAGLRGRARLPRGAIDIRLTLIAASLICGAYERCLAIAVVSAMCFDGKLTHRRLAAGNDATLSRWAVRRNVAGIVALARGTHQGLAAITVEYARATCVYLLRCTAADEEQ
jgi:hypothetical protein